MATISLKLDTRRANAQRKFPIQFLITHNSRSTTIGTGIAIKTEHWNGEINKVVTPQCPNARQINTDLEALYFKYTNALRALEIDRDIRWMSVTELKNHIIIKDEVRSQELFTDYFERYATARRTENSRIACSLTLKTIFAFCGPMQFSDLTVVWLKAFEAHLSERGNSINTRAFHFRNIRAVINSAIDEDIVGQEYYPFRKFKITATRKAKESLTSDQMKALFAYTSPVKNRQLARDLLVLSFCLCGINLVDLYNMQELRGGRAVFVRAKTAGRNEDSVSLALQPEAKEIIDYYRGADHVLRFSSEFPNYATFNNRIQKQVRELAKELNIEGMTYYWMRYTWATLADKLGIAEKEISKALGHADRTVAGRFYISYDWDKVDKANRRVLDHVLGKAGKKGRK